MLQAQPLGHVDLDVIDHVPVPDRLEQAVGEAEREDVEGRFLAEEVIGAEDLGLVEDLVHFGVQESGTRQIGAERLLHHDAGPLDQIGVAQRLDHGSCPFQGHGQVVQPMVRAVHPVLDLLDRGAQ